MTEDRFRKLSFKKAMVLTYQTERMKEPIECILLTVDFDNETVRLVPLDSDMYEENEFWTTINYIELPKRKMKVIK